MTRDKTFRSLAIAFRIIVTVYSFGLVAAGMKRIASARPPYLDMQQMWGKLSIAIGIALGVLSLAILIGFIFQKRWAIWTAFLSDSAIVLLLLPNIPSRNFLPALVFCIPFLLDAVYMAKSELNLWVNSPCAEREPDSFN